MRSSNTHAVRQGTGMARDARPMGCSRTLHSMLAMMLAGAALPMVAQWRRPPEVAPPIPEERAVGPYDVHVLAGGPALEKPVPAESHVLQATGSYTLVVWVRAEEVSGDVLLAGVGDPATESSHFLGVFDGKAVLRYGPGNRLMATAPLPKSGWHMVSASSDGIEAHLFVDGGEVAHGALPGAKVGPVLVMAPTAALSERVTQHFGGDLAGVTLLPEALPVAEIRHMAAQPPNVPMLRMEEASKPWPVQTRGQAGYTAPQDPSLMPHSRAPFAKAVAEPLPAPPASALQAAGTDRWLLRGRWMLTAAPGVTANGAAVSTAGFSDKGWMAATVPGTVLTTMVDRGVYPDPDFGLNNLAIPESLNKQDYWYRIEFETPQQAAAGRSMTLTFEGINYAAEAWLNGTKLGDVKGAFIRGQFAVGALLRKDGRNALAVRISPPPHPGIPQEQSVLGGPGENGGLMELDGPTFLATEGWDWIPAIRDRNSGIWQDVVLAAAGSLVLGDPQVITHLPLPDTSSADVVVRVPVRNASGSPQQATVHASFEGVTVTKKVSVPPGESVVEMAPGEFPELHLQKPRLWWPNGYGRPDLYHLSLAVDDASGPSDTKQLTFGVREITYELSLFDSTGHLQRVEVDPTVARAAGERVVDVRHEGMRQTQEYWASSLTAVGEHSAAVKPVSNEPGFTDLVLKVNGVRIAARGGNWGMDDSRKRVSRERLEPFFRLHREANVNIIRNWVGQNTEETFYQLADEYGMMVWNDFWESTQDYNIEAQDVPLFLANAKDTVDRFRNHPSIVMWCGRNEGVPQPILNEGLIALLGEEDGTRYYTPGSNRINLRNSGPYLYQDPTLYYTTLDKGFSVELGTASLSTLESLRASMSAADLWPVGDAYAYHDWHQSGNGDVHPFMDHLATEFGAATDLKDFERKAQMMNYVNHRAIFEGFNQHLWAPNSGRMLWMTQPAWPSNYWQIFSHDYDTQGSFYGVKKACEPLHVQLDLSNYKVAAVNTTGSDAPGMTVRASVYSVAGAPLSTREQSIDLKADATLPLFSLELAPLFPREGVVLVKLEMVDAHGGTVSSNVYWLAGEESQYRKLSAMPSAQVSTHAVAHAGTGESSVEVELTNKAATPVLAVKLTLEHAANGERVLPAYFSDNYISLLPNETRKITIQYPSVEGAGALKLAVRGWNLAEGSVRVEGTR